MKRLVGSGLVAAFLLTHAAPSRAQTFYTPPPPMPPPQGVVAPNSIVAGNQVYPASVSGVRDLVETYRDGDAALYAKLDEKAGGLEGMRTRARIIGISTALVGVGMIVGGFALYDPGPPGSTTPPNFTPIWVAVAGVPLVMLSYFIGKAFGPSREDYMSFVNHHNRLVPDKPIKWQLGAVPTPNGVALGSGLSVRF